MAVIFQFFVFVSSFLYAVLSSSFHSEIFDHLKKINRQIIKILKSGKIVIMENHALEIDLIEI